MVMKTYFKTVGRMFQKHIVRIISLFAIVFIAVGFVSGIGSSSEMINKSVTDYYKAQNVSDLIIKSTDGIFTSEQVEAVKQLYGEDNVQTGLSLDIETTENRSMRVYFIDIADFKINVPELIDGSKIENGDDAIFAYAERSDNVIKGYSVNDDVEIDLGDAFKLPFEYKLKVKIKGIVQSPLTFAKDGEPSYNNPEDAVIPDNIADIYKMDLLDNILYVSTDLSSMIPVGDIYVKLADRDLFDAFSDGYKTYVEEQKGIIYQMLGDGVRIITLNDNYSFKSIIASASKVRAIGDILMAIFLAVTILVVLSSMMRLMDEDRSQIACLKTLGYSSYSIVFRYILFSLVPLVLGGVAGYFVGLGLTWLIGNGVFNYSYVMPPVSTFVNPAYFFLSAFVIIGITVFAILFLGLRLTNDKPANLLRPKAPKSGKKVFLERIPFIWKKLSFKYKSSFRNVFRYKGRFFMMLISVAVSSGLVFAGLALLDMCLFSDFGSGAIVGIAVVVVIFAGLLTAVVINTLTTINISERNREIATLMVLGYTDNEVCGYIYREIYINTVIGILFGYPVGVGLATLIFKTIGFGTVGGVSWFMWLAVPFIVLAVTAVVTLLLRRKIVKTDMNASLKAIE